MFRNINISDTKLGKGSYASVFKGTMLHNGKQREVAVKKFPNDGEHYSASAQKEYDVLSRLKTHPNIIQLFDMKHDENFIYMIMEYAEWGDLDKFVEKNIPVLKEKVKIMLETVIGIKYMHSLQPPVIHRDIKPGNILMQSSPQGPVAKICDFGLARIFNTEATSLFMSTDAGTPMYRAPEQFIKGRQQYTSAVDVFSLGLVYMGLLNVSRTKPQIQCIPESLYGTDMLPYAQHLKEALRHNTPMPALFILNSADKWPETELKGIITQMAAFKAADRMNIEDVENRLQTIMSAYSSAAAPHRNLANRKDEEISELSSLLTDVLQDKEDMKQRYEQRLSEMEEQLASKTLLSPPQSKEATHTAVLTSSQTTATAIQPATSSGEATTVKSIIRKMEEQLALANQQESGNSKSKITLSPPGRKDATHTAVKASSSSQKTTGTTTLASSPGKSTAVMSRKMTLITPQNPGCSSENTNQRSPHESAGATRQSGEKTGSSESAGGTRQIWEKTGSSESTGATRQSAEKTGSSESAGATRQSGEKTGSSEKITQLRSFRNTVPGLHRLSGHSPSLVNNFMLRKDCARFCYYDTSIYCCCYDDDCIDVYSLEGEFLRNLALGDISEPRALHPLSAGRLVLAAQSGLFVMGEDGGDITCVKQGSYEDVHVNGSNMVTLKNYDSAHDSVESDSVCVLSSTAPHTQKATFTLGHTLAHTVLLHQDTVYVSDWDTHHVTAYSLTGERLSQWGGVGRGPGELYYPLLCATDSSGRVLVADLGNGRLELVTAGGEWVVVPGLEVVGPADVILLTDRMWVPHGELGDRQISVYKL